MPKTISELADDYAMRFIRENTVYPIDGTVHQELILVMQSFFRDAVTEILLNSVAEKQ